MGDRIEASLPIGDRVDRELLEKRVRNQMGINSQRSGWTGSVVAAKNHHTCHPSQTVLCKKET